MCGILGFFGTGIDQNQFEKALNLMQHRGPDDQGILKLDKNCLLGHKRLSIIDLSANGHQPMQSQNKRFTIVFNGEIYNYKILREDLISKGYSFRSNSDTEVILLMYEHMGDHFIEKLSGIFSFAIYDNLKKELKLFRDRYGVKPVYYYKSGNTFAFSSEIRSLVALNDIPKQPDLDAYFSFLQYGAVQSPLTVYKDINMLPAAHCITYANNKITLARYYEINFRPNVLSYEDSVDNVKYLLQEAVQSQMVSDLPVGAFLSGGVDSSAVVALMRKGFSGKIKTFSIDFEEKKYSEGHIAKLVAEQYDTEHHQCIVTADDLKKEFYNILDSLDSPSIDGVNTYFVSKFTKEQGITVALSGLGGDEIFGGYESFSNFSKLIRLKNSLSFLPNKVFKPLKNLTINDRNLKMIEFLSDKKGIELSAYLALRSLIQETKLKKLLKFDHSDKYYDHFKDEFSQRDYYSQENMVSYLETSVYMGNQLLRDSDNMSMAHSLELRVPLIDQKLVDFCATIPGKYKHDKKVLVDAVKELIPPEVFNRPKQGFSFPFEEWIRTGLLNEVKDLFFLKNNLYNEKYLMKLWEGFENRKVSWSRIWAIVVLNYYVEKFNIILN